MNRIIVPALISAILMLIVLSIARANQNASCDIDELESNAYAPLHLDRNSEAADGLLSVDDPLSGQADRLYQALEEMTDE